MLLNDLQASVRRATVRQNIFHIWIILRKDQLDTRLEKWRLVVGDRDDGEFHTAARAV